MWARMFICSTCLPFLLVVSALSQPMKANHHVKFFCSVCQPSQPAYIRRLMRLRGGVQFEHEEGSGLEMDNDDTSSMQFGSDMPPLVRTNSQKTSLLGTSAIGLPVLLLTKIGKSYSTALNTRPILTKSITAGIIFAMSDILAQCLEKRPKSETDSEAKRIELGRILASTAVGFFYFGPAAHYWYSMMFRILPGKGLASTLQKAFLGQAIFGPPFTCIFFGSVLMQSGQFTLSNWMQKIRRDLPSAWLAGAGFWPLVDLLSYSFVQPQYIPLAVNLASLVWTTYLVLKSYN